MWAPVSCMRLRRRPAASLPLSLRTHGHSATRYGGGRGRRDEGMKRRRTVDRRPSAPQSSHARLHCACEVFYPMSIALLSHKCFHHSSSQSRPPSTQSAACSRKSSEHFASIARASPAGSAKLDIIRGHQSALPPRAGEATARLEKRGQSMSTSA